MLSITVWACEWKLQSCWKHIHSCKWKMTIALCDCCYAKRLLYKKKVKYKQGSFWKSDKCEAIPAGWVHSEEGWSVCWWSPYRGTSKQIVSITQRCQQDHSTRKKYNARLHGYAGQQHTLEFSWNKILYAHIRKSLKRIYCKFISAVKITCHWYHLKQESCAIAKMTARCALYK